MPRWWYITLTDFLLELHSSLGVVVPVKQLLLFYELCALSIGQLSSKVLWLKQVQEMQTLRISANNTMHTDERCACLACFRPRPINSKIFNHGSMTEIYILKKPGVKETKMCYSDSFVLVFSHLRYWAYSCFFQYWR